MKRLVLIDGHAILYRAFHALPPLNTQKGELVNAIYGFVSMLLRVIEDLKPGYVAVCFDLPKPTFRNKLFKDYQSTRPKMDEGLAGQIKRMHGVLNTMQIPIFEKEGYEADDLLGTIAKKIKADEVLIVTGDRDLMQLVDDKIKLYMPLKGLSESKIYGAKEVKEKLGVDPKEVIEYKALVGDQSDNYPGVPGIGPMTAIRLIEKYKNIENLYKHIDAIQNANIKKKLEKGKESANISKKLATIDIHAPLDVDIDKCKLHDLNTMELMELFDALGFRSLIGRLNSQTTENIKQKTVDREKEKKDIQQIKLF